jgi:ribonuclease P protein component
MRKSLTRKERLKTGDALRRAFASRRQVSCAGAKIRFVENDAGLNRIAISITRKYGNAVERNRAKRTVREIYRNMKHELRPGFDIAIILYPGQVDYSQRKQQLDVLFRKAGLASGESQE